MADRQLTQIWRRQRAPAVHLADAVTAAPESLASAQIKAGSGGNPKGGLRALLALLVLTLLHTINIGDRALLSVLGQSVKLELHLTDSQLGNLSGVAFAVVYAIAALPLSRLADRGYHRSVIAASVMVWSLMTILGAGARNYTQMALTRVGVATGEASLDPASHKIIFGMLGEKRRPMAMAIYALGLPVGMIAGSVLAGVLAERFGWRTAFWVTGACGLAALPAAWFLIPKIHVEPVAKVSVLEAMRRLLADPAMRNLCLGYGTASMFGFSVGAFLGPFLARSFGLSPMQIGSLVGTVIGLAMIVGTFGGGLLQDWFGRTRPSRGLLPVVAGLLLSAGIAMASFLVGNLTFVIIATAVSQMLYLIMFAPSFTTAQVIAPPEFRATASALLGLSGGLLGATFGPFLTGLMSDLLAHQTGAASLRYALCMITSFELLGAWFYWRASRLLVARELNPPTAHLV